MRSIIEAIDLHHPFAASKSYRFGNEEYTVDVVWTTTGTTQVQVTHDNHDQILSLISFPFLTKDFEAPTLLGVAVAVRHNLSIDSITVEQDNWDIAREIALREQAIISRYS
jgi:hypothetical protein